MKGLREVIKQDWVIEVEDRREDGERICVWLAPGWEFADGRRWAEFDTVAQTVAGTARSNVSN